MGQKIHPTGFRLSVTRNWTSRWYANSKNFPQMLKEDIEVRDYLKKKLAHASVGRVVIERPAKNARVTVYSARPGVVIGKKAKHLTMDEVPGVIFGYTTTLDLTALDVLKKNTRYLTRAKSFDTFFSFGPVIVTADEIADVNALEVVTEHNDGICSRDFVNHMRHRPYELVRFHSNYMTLYPGDLISTGCPKGARIKSGDRVRARIDGVGTLSATVR